MSDLKIITNNKMRVIVRWHDLTPKEQAEFDYLDTEDRQDSTEFFRYRGNVYDIGEFMSCKSWPDVGKWEGYHSESAFSGILIRIVDDYERVIVGRYIS